MSGPEAASGTSASALSWISGRGPRPIGGSDAGAIVDELLADGSVLLDVLFSRTVMGVAVFDRDLVLRTCNATWARFVGRHGVVTAADVVPGRSIFDYFPGTESRILPAATRVLAGETRWYQAVPHDRRDGGTSYWDLLFVPLWKDGEVVGVVDVSIDATERHRVERELRHTERRFESIRTEAEAELARRDAILEAVRFAAHRFLESDAPWRAHIGEVMAWLGRAAAVSRVYIFENYYDEAGVLRCSQSHEWVAAGISAQIDNSELQGFTFAEIGFVEPAHTMAEGQVVASLVAEMGPARAVLKAQGILSIVLVPIFVQDRWWGFIGFDECVRERNWSGAEIDALRAAASTLSAAIHRQHSEDLLREQQDLLVKRVKALSTIAASLTVNQELGASLDVIADAVVAATPAIACSAYVLEPESGGLRMFSSVGLPDGYPEAIERCWRSAVDSVTSRAFLARDLVVVRDAVAKGLANPGLAPLHPLLREVGWDCVAVVPLESLRRSLGSVNAYYPRGVEPTPDDIAFLRAVADQGAVAVENARLLAEAQSRAGLEERQRLARELHDSVSQALYGIALGARTARSLAEHSPEQLAEPLDYVLSLADAGMTEMRSLIFALRPESLATEGLVAALEKQVAVLRTRHGMTVDATLGDEPRLPLAIKEALYRIGQEALHNTVKHAHASHVRVRLGMRDEETVLEIDDDGVGFDPLAARPGHLGLQSMRERAAAHRGRVVIDSRVGAGTTVRVHIPSVAQAAPPPDPMISRDSLPGQETTLSTGVDEGVGGDSIE